MIPPAAYMDRADDLRALADRLAREPLLAIDTESNSLHAYRERVCLIQLSTRTADYILDPYAIRDMQPLAPLFADPNIEKVFHAAEYDLLCMKRDFGFEFNNLFDTMIAARVCGYKQIGLGALLSEVAGVSMDKKHQRDNWGQRPLPEESLIYAQMDTHYLPLLRDHFLGELSRLNRLEEARESFYDVSRVPAARAASFDPEGYWRIGVPNHLARREMAILRELYFIRERLAEQRDLPPFKIFSDKTMVAVAQKMPTTPGELQRLDGMSPAQNSALWKPAARRRDQRAARVAAQSAAV